MSYGESGILKSPRLLYGFHLWLKLIAFVLWNLFYLWACMLHYNVLLLYCALVSMKWPYSSLLASLSLKPIVYYIKTMMPTYFLLLFAQNTVFPPFTLTISILDGEVYISEAVERKMLFSGPVCWPMSFDWASKTITIQGYSFYTNSNQLVDSLAFSDLLIHQLSFLLAPVAS